MHRGYVKSWRKQLFSGMMKNHRLFTFWHWCLLKATHKKIKHMVGFQEVELLPGQFIFGRRSAAEELAMTEQSVRTCLNSLISNQQLTSKTTNKFSIVTIINWDTYQSDDEPINQQITGDLTNNQPTTNQQLTTNKNDKNEKNNIKDIKTPPYSGEFELFWKAYPKHTAKKNAWAEWRKLNGTRPPIETIVKAIENQKKARHRKLSAGQFAPEFQDPERWIKRERWNDEIEDPEMAKQMSLDLIRAELEERKRGI